MNQQVVNFLKMLKKYFKLWWYMSKVSFINVTSQRISFVVFLVGKVIRFSFFFGFLFFILQGSKSLGVYNGNQVIFFFLTFSLLDTIGQFLFREVYRFRPKIVNGDFDLILSKPVNALFRSLMGGADVIDLVILVPLTAITFYFGYLLNPGILHAILYLLLIINGLFISMAFHIAILSFAIITTEIDHAVMIFRDVANLGKLPVDIYKEPLKAFITYLIPVGIMVTLPAKALMGLVSVGGVFGAFAVSALTVAASMLFWNRALRKYQSASS